MRIIISTYVLTLFLMVSCNHTNKTTKNKAVPNFKNQVSSYLLTQNSIGKNRVDTLLSESFIRNMNGIQMVSNISEHKSNMHVFLNGFPDMTFTFPTQLIKGNEAFIVWIFTGTHTGTFGEINATGKKVKVNGISHLFFDKEGKIYREDVFYNKLDLLQQLGFTLNLPITE
ncbi:hypothetical protein EGM88_12010 [Aureibaculum marinum]|uniref:Ester cyclase n=1 Tax=Aureibaculum marinum TaxID=2487930 RepID=A0A3N4NQS2_9FLAO|nr:ester cyclase [Aureibaculum marinum]RPD94460.1 hypothetical protein EGM88_12010 [Aureibaculum marinum]